MSTRYHVNTETGESGVCGASVRNCPFGGETGVDNHYNTEAEAVAAGERLLAEKYNPLRGVKMAAIEKPTVENFVSALQDKFNREGSDHFLSIMKGRKYDRIVIQSGRGQRSVFGFMDRDGNLYKAASWKAPAKDARFTADELMTTALDKADPYGGFLYKK